jgi:HK97 family phage major capsid protein/HK97 family phage prohead protease
VLTHGYAVLHVKSVDADSRTITGIATTPTPDRMGDVLDPFGATFTNPLPLLLHHDSKLPVGRVMLEQATAAGIAFTAVLPHIPDPGPLRDRVNEAWQSIKAGLMTGVSVGYRILADGITPLAGHRGMKLSKTEICELSLVTVPANMECTIRTVKALDAPFRAAIGPAIPPRDRGPLHVGPTMTLQEKIQNFENTRAAKVARMAAIMDSAGTESTLDDTQREEYDGLTDAVKSIDADLIRFHDLEKLNSTTAVPVVGATGIKAAGDLRGGIIRVTPNVPKGTEFVRWACAILACNGNKHEAAQYAERWNDSTPSVALGLKAAVAPGTTTDPAWAGPLVNQNIANEFLELLRPATILGKIENLREVPLNTKVPAQTAGGTYGWVGESKPKPVTKLAFATESLGVAKAAGIIVLTEELVRLSNPKAEEICRRDMIAGIAQFLDQQFTDPAVAAVTGVNPASITNGAATAAATTNPVADILGLINHFSTNNISVDGVTFIMSASNALSLSFRTNLDGSPEFPGIGINGGTYKGLKFITSNTVGTNVIALQPQLILYADDGGVTIDASREASLQMDSAPMSPADATTVYVSLWQTNCVGLRAERFINWKRVGTNAVKYLTATAWPAPTGGLAPVAESAKGR